MPWTIQVEPDSPLTFVTFRGELACPDLCDAVSDQMRHPNWDPLLPCLWDLRRARITADFDEFQSMTARLAEIDREQVPPRLAFVVRHDIDAMITKLYGRVRPGSEPECETFERIDKALQWLGVDDAVG